jgi:hypothetical protein
MRLINATSITTAIVLIAAPVAAAQMTEAGAPRRGPIHRLIHKLSALDGACTGNPHPGQEQECRRRDALYDRVERMGWCWGSTHRLVAVAEYYWLRCNKDRTP